MQTELDPTAQPQGQSQPNATPAQGQQGDPSQQSAPAPEALQQQLEQARREAEETKARAAQIEESYRHLQTDYTRKSQALAQLSGAPLQQQPVDPVTRNIQELKAKGYKEEDIRPVLEANARVAQEVIQAQIAPLQQQLAATAAYSQVGAAMQQAAQDPMVASLLADPQIATYVQSQLSMQAQQGVQPHPAIAQNLAYMMLGHRTAQQQQQPAPQPAPQQQQAPYGVPQFPGMTYPGSGFTARPAVAQTAPALTLEQQALQAEINKYTGAK